MGRNWQPKHAVKCEKCDWTGTRASIRKPCPRCGFYYPKPAEVVNKLKA